MPELPPEASQSTSIREQVAALDGQRALVCVRSATVTSDQRKATPYSISGDVVGEVSTIRSGGFWLVGLSFTTRVEWHDVRAIWKRDEAPDPCPLCGGTG